METGIVLWFNDETGHGRISPDTGGESLFASYKCIRGEGLETLIEGQKVSYQTALGPNGLQADRIVPLDNPNG